MNLWSATAEAARRPAFSKNGFRKSIMCYCHARHDEMARYVCRMSESTLTERGQISIPASLRKAMKLRPGQRLKFTPVSDHEFRVNTQNDAPPGPKAMLGYARRLRAGPARRTSEWMRELREGEIGP
jgi:AbrB family looped-hinge helix DNA binding protein